MSSIKETKNGGIERVKNKLELSINNQNYYEAHQMYRTLYARYSQKQKHEEARELILSGARLLFTHQQNGSAVDLSLLFVDSLQNSKRPVDEETISVIAELHSNFDENHPDIVKFENKALHWTAIGPDAPKTGDVQMRKLFAQTQWKRKNFVEARQHFIYSHDGSGCGEMLVEFALNHGKTEEDDLFIAQAVLQLLCIHSVQTAHDAFNKYMELHPRITVQNIPFPLPLLNFVFFLLAAIDSRKRSWFTVLCEQYQTCIGRDPLYYQYLEKIGENFFDLKFPKKKDGGMLQNLFRDLFEDGDTEEAPQSSKSQKSPEPVEDMKVDDLD